MTKIVNEIEEEKFLEKRNIFGEVERSSWEKKRKDLKMKDFWGRWKVFTCPREKRKSLNMKDFWERRTDFGRKEKDFCLSWRLRGKVFREGKRFLEKIKGFWGRKNVFSDSKRKSESNWSESELTDSDWLSCSFKHTTPIGGVSLLWPISDWLRSKSVGVVGEEKPCTSLARTSGVLF